jgi:glutaredoxin 3
MGEKITKKHCLQFLKNPSVDPITQKRIVKGKSTYNKWMEKAQKFQSGGAKKNNNNNKCKGVPLPKDDDWTIYTLGWCGYCKAAKSLLKEKKQKFIEHDVSELSNVNSCLSNLTKEYQLYPMIFKKGKFIGGFSDLKNYF